MKIEELNAQLEKEKEKGKDKTEEVFTRPGLLPYGSVPFSICFPHTPRRSAREMETQRVLDEAFELSETVRDNGPTIYNPETKRFESMRRHLTESMIPRLVKRKPDAHLGAVGE